MIYGLAIDIRNKLYDWAWLPHIDPQTYPQYLISVGNITVGGTGKTPLIEYLLTLLSAHVDELAVVSRGYKRKSKGLQYVQTTDTSEQMGDEPLQIKRKFPDVTVVVSVARELALYAIAQNQPNCRLVLLDDAFQYRKLIPQYQIVLMDYHRPVWKDRLLPWGRLRDRQSQLRRADMLIVTKCPSDMTEAQRQVFRSKLNIAPHQSLFFTQIVYASPVGVFISGQTISNQARVMAVAAIAQPQSFFTYVRQHYQLQHELALADHQHFDKALLDELESKCHDLDAIFTTEKDSVKLLHWETEMSTLLKSKLFYIPIKVSPFDPNFDKFITAKVFASVSHKGSVNDKVQHPKALALLASPN